MAVGSNPTFGTMSKVTIERFPEGPVEWNVVTAAPASLDAVRALPEVGGVTSAASPPGPGAYGLGVIAIPRGVHHSLVGMAAAALAAVDHDALLEVLQQCGRPTPRAVCLYAEDDAGRVLAVSRKNDRTRFGLPGGKVDPGETDLDALVREVAEETGLRVQDPRPEFEKLCWGSTCYVSTTFTGRVSGDPRTSEPIDIRWVGLQALLDGPFGDYNRRLFRKMGKIL